MWNTSSNTQAMEKSSGCDYEVFLSFRGPDTCTNITSYLYTSMIDAGIRAYKDDEELRTGEEIEDHLLQAIEQSKISIPIFSKGYADSPWCLRELVKMVENKNTRRQIIMPIFYDVAPSEVKYHKEHYGKAIVSHLNKKMFNHETIYKWKAALSEVGALIGWDFQSMPNRAKGEFVKEVVNNVLTELKTTYLEVSGCLVEVDNHVDEIMRMIGAHDHETKIVGIHGMGGVGKTTLAKIVYNQLYDDFINCCFLSNIRETKITQLQNQLIWNILKKKWHAINNIMEGKMMIKEKLCSKRVLLLLDDADDASQLDALVQNCEWFGKGSKIIITTRDQGMLKESTLVDGTYELTGMDHVRSLQLFSKHAFRRDYPLEQYISHSARAVNICGGLPLALEIIGSLLSGKNVEEWDATLKELEESPQEDIGKTLMIGIKALNDNQRKIFLDIACFFIGYDKRIVIHMWESCDFLPHQSLGILQQRSLIKIREDNQLWMHDWLRDIGRNFIRQGSGKKSEQQQLLWTHAQASMVLGKTQLIVDLKVLNLTGCQKLRRTPNLSFHVNLERLILEGCESLVQIDPSISHLKKLVFLNLKYCYRLRKLPKKMGALESLRELLLDSTSIKGILEWRKMNKLEILSLVNCHSLEKFDFLDTVASVVKPSLVDNPLTRLPKSFENFSSLIELDLSYSGVQELPNSIGKMKNLKVLKMRNSSIRKLPSSIGMLEKLERLEAGGDPYLEGEIPNDIGKLRHVRILILEATRILALPQLPESLITLYFRSFSMGLLPDLSNLLNMRNLSLRLWGECNSPPKLEEAPSGWWIGRLRMLEVLELFCPNITTLSSDVIFLSQLKRLQLVCCNLQCLPRLPTNLSYLMIDSGWLKTTNDLSNLKALLDLNVRACDKLTEIQGLEGLENLRSLELEFLQSLAELPDLTSLKKLKKIHLKRCPKLFEIQDSPISLEILDIEDCLNLQKLPDPSCFKNLKVWKTGLQVERS
ncbi:hypothetical protein BT93_E1328 [Corymbia citriodora subsp. variegata]|nr:hypothetical protein BT93_E1328 [Corymbia citriodora subsp. variegata]